MRSRLVGFLPLRGDKIQNVHTKTYMSNILRLLILLLGCALYLAGKADAQESPKAKAAWWLEQHGALTEDLEPRIALVRGVWERVEAASERSPKRLPRLVLLRSHHAPMAHALPDGSVLLNRAAIRLCYDGVKRELGDARMAFLLGHELAHLAKDDFWAAEAFSRVGAVPEIAEARVHLEQLLRRSEPDGKNQAARLRELQADAHGLIAMTAAGYNPKRVLDVDSTFFQLWSARVIELQGQSPAPAQYPADAERAALLRSQLSAVRRELLVFDAGTKLQQLGRYDDARVLLEHFRGRFPGREIFNNLGLSEYRLAMRELAGYDARWAARYFTALVADLETMGTLTRGRTGGPARGPGKRCVALLGFQTHFRRALKYFEKASRMDPEYLPARVNLSSARLTAGDYAGAMSAADQVLRVNPEQREAMNNKAVALHAFGREMGMDTTDRALSVLETILRKHPDYAAAAYNRAVLLTERQRPGSAGQAWERLLRYRLPPLYRARVYMNLGRTEPPPGSCPKGECFSPHVPGRVDPPGEGKVCRDDLRAGALR